MKIGLPLDINNVGHESCAQRPARGVSTTGASASVDRVALSAAGSQLSAAGMSADFDSEKVDSIKEAIRTGQFRVNSEVISERLIAEASALLGPKAH